MERYSLEDEELPPGSQAIVYVAKDNLTSKTMALKKIALAEEGEIPKSVIREASLLLDLRHDNIVRLDRVFVAEDSVYLALEYLPMDLNTHMAWHDDKYPALAKKFLKQILSGVSYCHSHKVWHRDLKPQNVLVDTRNEAIKICDFGLARGFVSPNLALSPEVVTLGYRAPEVLMGSGQYSSSIDLWSVGCIFAEMLTKEPLFYGTSEIEALDEIFRLLGTPTEDSWPGVSSLSGFPNEVIQAQPEYFGSVTRHLEAGGVDLLQRLLCLDPDRRITAEAALAHEYFTR
ncbi:cell division control protein 2 homolog [Rhododendron vialii]|uniref:cell division control protein 2 homolog n=1 Tax=Rhododendron vialii TaxID=182163 RepID=UPI00266013ED|nr:cell division control protein 2 homolog [Rhododendron vialii]